MFFQSQLEEAEQKVATMSTEMEKMKEEFKSKQESFVVLDEQYKVGLVWTLKRLMVVGGPCLY